MIDANAPPVNSPNLTAADPARVKVVAAWANRSPELTEWADQWLVNRRDAFGHYKPVGERRGPKDTAYTDKTGLTVATLQRHFEGRSAGDLVGLHSTYRDEAGKCWSRWLGVDIDLHDKGDPKENWRFALVLFVMARSLGFTPLLLDSNGRGGYHLLIIFAAPVPTERVFAFGRWLIRDWKAHGLAEEPETFPKQPCVTPDHPYGNWLRLSGRHHTHDHYTRVWNGSEWLEGDAAIDVILATVGSSEDLIPAEARPRADDRSAERDGQARKTTSASRAEDLELARDAIRFVPNDDVNYNTWLRIGMTLRGLGEEGRQLFHEWSKQSQKYDAATTDKKFDSLTPERGVTLGTLFYEAERHGWTGFKPSAKLYWPDVDDPADPGTRESEQPSKQTAEPATARPTGVPVNDPHWLAEMFLLKHCQHQDQDNNQNAITLAYHRGEFHHFNGKCFQVYKDTSEDLTESIKNEFDKDFQARCIEHAKQKSTGKPPVLKPVTTALVGNVKQALRSKVAIAWEEDAPCWIGDGSWTDRDPLEIVAANNVLVHLPTLETLPHTPRLFTPYVLEYPWIPDVPMPARWIKFLSELWPKDPQSVRQLQKWFGLALTLETRYQTILMLVGPPGSGKGTILRVLTGMVGSHNVATPSIPGLARQFGLWPLVGKSLCLFTDTQAGGSRSDNAIALEYLLKISGEDHITIDRKYQEPLTTKLFTRLMIVGNSPPDFREPSGALIRRLIPLELTSSWKGKEDMNLTDTLMAELPGILKWSIEGRRLLKEDRGFTVPETAKGLLGQMGEMLSPITSFASDCLEILRSDARKVEELPRIRDIFDAYIEWCEDTRHECRSINIFGRHLRQAFRHIDDHRPESGDRERRYRGLELNEKGKEYLRRHSWAR
jgi:putative DNA primase/helicase